MSSHRSQQDDTRMLTALVRLRQALSEAELPFDADGVAELRAHRVEMVDQLEDYVIPRLMTVEAPLLAVVGGSTGAGKSTLVNSLVGHRVTVPGVLRPTTRSPVLVHHPDDAHWFGQDRLLPDLVRVDHTTNDPDSLQLVATDAIDPGLAILDAPDVDSVEERNRLLSAQLLAAADLWLFVTSAARYADQVPWMYLRQAAERSTAVAVVLDRTPDEAIGTVATHLARMLSVRGLKDSPLFTVREGAVDDQGLLPAAHVREIREWLDALAADADARGVIVKQTLDGAVRSLTRRTYPIADAMGEQADVSRDLTEGTERAYGEATTALRAAVTDASILRGDTLVRWQELVGSGDLLRTLDSRVGGLRERLVNSIKGKPQQAEVVALAVEEGLEALVLDHAERGAAAAHAVWSGSAAGRALLAEAPGGAGADLARASRDLRRRAEKLVRDWQLEVLDVVRRESSERRTSAKLLAFGVNGLAVSMMVVATAAGPDGRRTETAAQPGRTLLDAVFGVEWVDGVVTRSAASLDARVTALLAEEQARYDEVVSGLTARADAADRLRSAARRVDDLRFEAADAAKARRP